ncbi:MAG: Rv2175c family DNA-binding protein [Dermatophilaceae bacterium]
MNDTPQQQPTPTRPVAGERVHEGVHDGAPEIAREAEHAEALEAVVPGWLTLPGVAERQGVGLHVVRQQLKDREILAVRRTERGVLCVPESFVTSDGPRPELRGTFTVLVDGGMSDIELLTWLFTLDETLTGGSPMGAILAGHKTEVRRRAMELAY